ncbi:MAG: cytidine deaminase [Ruminococcaceae bacterium]|nr:cytidine deaminase [Oscillospiraceae bacterium]
MSFDRKALLRKAMEARKFSYAPFSRFHVGAALLSADGRIFTGCNIENSAYSPTLCAERCAVAKAVSEGVRNFVAIAVVGPENSQTTPCGVCRQVLYEFCDENLSVLCGGTDENYMETTLGALLPNGFRLS